MPIFPDELTKSEFVDAPAVIVNGTLLPVMSSIENLLEPPLAESLAVLRPLVPYPEWRFDADWYNPDLSFQIRQRLWQYFADRGCEVPVRVSWHSGTHLCLYLNNDLSRQIFIAGCADPNEFEVAAERRRQCAPGDEEIAGNTRIFQQRRVTQHEKQQRR